MANTITMRDLQAITRISNAASKDSGRPILTGVHLEVEDDKLVAVATDSYVLAKTEVDNPGWPKDMTVLVPALQLRIAERTFRQFEPNADEIHTVVDDSGHLILEGFDTRLVLRTLYSDPAYTRFPKWRALAARPEKPLTNGAGTTHVNPKITKQVLSMAPKSMKYPVKVELFGELQPIRFTTKLEPGWLVLQMPVQP